MGKPLRLIGYGNNASQCDANIELKDLNAAAESNQQTCWENTYVASKPADA
jgi:hypothetical protein